jgi:hypothetical protein
MNSESAITSGRVVVAVSSTEHSSDKPNKDDRMLKKKGVSMKEP